MVGLDKEFFAWNLDISDELTRTLTMDMIPVALFVAGICVALNVAHNFITTAVRRIEEGDGHFINISEIGRIIVLVVCISSYSSIASTLVSTMDVVNKMTTVSHLDTFGDFLGMQEQQLIVEPDHVVLPNEAGNPTGNAVVDNSDKKKEEVGNDSSFGWGSVVDAVKTVSALINPSNFMPLIIHSLAMLIFGVIRIVVIGIAVIMTKVLVIVGPLAFAFSILPMFRKQLEQWFSTLITTGMVFTTLNILDRIVDAMLKEMLKGWISQPMDLKTLVDVTTGASAFEMLAIDFVLIILYASAFWLTSKFVGKGDAGRMLSKAVGAATTLAAIAMTGGAAAGGAGAGGVGSAANAGQNLIDQNDKE